MELWIVLCRLLAGGAGIVLVYGGLFLREGEERAVDNVLEAWWIQIDDLRHAALTRHTALTSVAAKIASKVLDKVFGEALWSVRAVASSICLSLVSLRFSSLLFYHLALTIDRSLSYSGDVYSGSPTHRTLSGIIVLFSIVLANEWVLIDIPVFVCVAALGASIFTGRLRHASVLGMVFCSAYFLTLFINPDVWMYQYIEVSIFIRTLLFGLLFDILGVVAVRQLLGQQSRAHSLLAMLVLAAAELCIAFALVLLPIGVGWGLLRFVPGRKGLRFILTAWSIALSGATNVLEAAVALSLFATLAVLVIHRIAWPVLERPLYRLARSGVFRHPLGRPTLVAVGCALLAVASGEFDAMALLIRRLFRSA